MLNRTCVPLCMLALAFATGVFAADWPAFRGPNADGISPETGISKDWQKKPPQLLWQVSLGDGGYAGPSAAGGKVFIIDHKGSKDIVRAIDIKTGKDLWQYPYEDTSSSNYGFARSTPAISDGMVYTLSRTGVLCCLMAADGKMVWWRNIVTDFAGRRPQWDYAASPLVDGNKLIVCPGSAANSVVALDKKTGKVIWKGGGGDIPGYATPVKATINGKAQYVVFCGKSVIGVDAANGALLWSYPWITQYDVNAACPLVIGNSVFITSGYEHGCAMLDISASGQAKVRWESKVLQSHFNSPILFGGSIYGIGDPGNLVCMDAQTGAVKWTQAGFEKGPVTGVDGAVFALDGSKGVLYLVALNPSACQVLASGAPLGGQSWTAPIIADGKLVIRNTTAMVCYSIK